MAPPAPLRSVIAAFLGADSSTVKLITWRYCSNLQVITGIYLFFTHSKVQVVTIAVIAGIVNQRSVVVRVLSKEH